MGDAPSSGSLRDDPKPQSAVEPEVGGTEKRDSSTAGNDSTDSGIKKRKVEVKKDNRNVSVLSFESATMQVDTAPIFFLPNTAGIVRTVELVANFYSARFEKKLQKSDFEQMFKYCFVSNMHRYLMKEIQTVRLTPYVEPANWFRLPQVVQRIITSLGSYQVKDSQYPIIYPDATKIVSQVSAGLGVSRTDVKLFRDVVGRWNTMIDVIARINPSSWYDKPRRDDKSLITTGCLRTGKSNFNYFSVAQSRLQRMDELLVALLRYRRFHDAGGYFVPDYVDDEKRALPQLLAYWRSYRPVTEMQFINEYLASEVRKG